MKKILVFKKCLLVDSDNPLVHNFPFAQVVMVKDPFNQLGFELQWGIDKGFIRLDGWNYSSKQSFVQMLDAIVELARINRYSCIYYFDEITDKEAEVLIKYGFRKGKSCGINQHFEMGVDTD